jgi:large subunit ribosomal protein L22e
VNGKTHNFQKNVKTKLYKNKVVVMARPRFAKRQLKYLTRRFLKKQSLRDWVRVIAKGKNGYRLSYYKIESPEEEEAEA